MGVLLIDSEDLDLYAAERMKGLQEDKDCPSDDFVIMAGLARLTMSQALMVIDWYNGRIGEK